MTEIKRKGLFSKIESRIDAIVLVEETTIGFFFVAGLQAILSIWQGVPVLVDAAIFALSSLFIRQFQSRVAAITLALYAAVSVALAATNTAGAYFGGNNNIFLSAILLWASIRAAEATIKLHGKFAIPENPKK
ncbi:MAG: hypothetical protein JZU72_01380 [Chlorobium phaeobacteroides]|jgi:hypothetical protein|nr:hypothetical protein [Chlorobium phaeobacteroides]